MSLPMEMDRIAIADLKRRIYTNHYGCRGTDVDLEVTNVQTGKIYVDDEEMVARHTLVSLRRLTRSYYYLKPISSCDNFVPVPVPVPTAVEGNFAQNSEEELLDDFGDLYGCPPPPPVVKSKISPPTPILPNRASKVSPPPILPNKRKANAADEKMQGAPPRPRMGMMGGFGFGGIDAVVKVPPPGYVCHRCSFPGHFIQHCPTNGLPEYDVKRLKRPTGIPRSRLMVTQDGSYALPTGDSAVLKPDEAAFEREIQGLIPLGESIISNLLPQAQESRPLKRKFSSMQQVASISAF